MILSIPMLLTGLVGSLMYWLRTVDLGVTMALILLSIIPVIIFYVSCQKHIVEGVAAGAVKG